MKKILLPCFAVLLCLAACKKNDETEQYYYTDYGLYYYADPDTFTAWAGFMTLNGTTGILEGKMPVRLNGRLCDYYANGAYMWKGQNQGRPDANFSLKKNGKTIENSIKGSELPDYKIIVPDTCYKSKGFTIVVNNYKDINPEWGGLQLNFAGKRTWGMHMKTDSLFIGSTSLKEVSEGRLTITLTEFVEKDISLSGDGDKGKIRYSIVWEKQAWLMP